MKYQNLAKVIKVAAKKAGIKKRVRCYHCGYSWIYKGDKEYATCPSCTRKVKVPKPLSMEKVREMYEVRFEV